MNIRNVLVKEFLRRASKPIYASEQTLHQQIARARQTEQGEPPASVLRTWTRNEQLSIL